RSRRDALLATLESFPPGCVWTHPDGGLSLWLTLPEGVNERDFCAAALERGVAVAPGRAFFLQPQPIAYLRFSFGAHAPEQIAHGAGVVGALLREHLRRRTLLLAHASRESAPLV